MCSHVQEEDISSSLLPQRCLVNFTNAHTEPLNSQRARRTSSTVPVTDKWAVECTDRPCDCSWHRTCYKSVQRHGRRNVPNLIGHLLSHVRQQLLTNLSRCLKTLPQTGKRAVGSVRGSKHRMVCVYVFVHVWAMWIWRFFFFSLRGYVRCMVMLWVNKWVLESAVRHEGSLTGEAVLISRFKVYQQFNKSMRENVCALKQLNHYCKLQTLRES